MKKYIKIVVVVIFAAIAGYGAYTSQKPTMLSELALSNVEALAGDESSDYGTLYGNSAGTKYCCCPGGSRTCGAATCSKC